MATKKLLKARKGFTFIELIITITIVGMVGMIGIGSYATVVRDLNFDVTARNIILDLKSAQAKAMAGNGGNSWGICFRSPVSPETDLNARYDIVSPPVSISCLNGVVSSNLKSTIYLPVGISFIDPVFSEAKLVTFNEITGGTTAGGDTQVVVTRGGETRITIIISEAGVFSSDKAD